MGVLTSRAQNCFETIRYVCLKTKWLTTWECRRDVAGSIAKISQFCKGWGRRRADEDFYCLFCGLLDMMRKKLHGYFMPKWDLIQSTRNWSINDRHCNPIKFWTNWDNVSEAYLFENEFRPNDTLREFHLETRRYIYPIFAGSNLALQFPCKSDGAIRIKFLFSGNRWRKLWNQLAQLTPLQLHSLANALNSTTTQSVQIYVSKLNYGISDVYSVPRQ